MYAKRNSITIALLWVIIMVIGIFFYTNENKKIKALKSTNAKLRTKLDGSLEIIQALEAVESKYRLLQEKWQHAPKQIIAADEPSFSLYYLNWLINKFNIPLEFDFELKDIKRSGDILSFNFLISGEGSYHDLYRFIWFLTENPLLYQIETFSLTQSKDNSNTIDFTMLIKGFSLTGEWESDQQFSLNTMKPVAERFQFHDSFRPLYKVIKPKRSNNMFRRDIKKVRVKTVDKSLIDIESATLQAVANNRVYIKDSNGKLHSMKVGDKVRYGTLIRINKKQSEVQFSLEKQGVTKTVTLGLGYRK